MRSSCPCLHVGVKRERPPRSGVNRPWLLTSLPKILAWKSPFFYFYWSLFKRSAFQLCHVVAPGWSLGGFVQLSAVLPCLEAAQLLTIGFPLPGWALFPFSPSFDPVLALGLLLEEIRHGLQSTWKLLQKRHKEAAQCLTTAKRRRKSRLGQDGHLGRGCVKSSDSDKVSAAWRDAWKIPNLQLQRVLLAQDLHP